MTSPTPATSPLDHNIHGGTDELSWSRSQSGASTPLPTPREAHEDPFNLIGFFPSRHAESQKEWSWIYGREETADKDMNVSAAEDFSVLGGYDYDEFAQKVIEGEDKYGMLGICELVDSGEKQRMIIETPEISI